MNYTITATYSEELLKTTARHYVLRLLGKPYITALIVYGIWAFPSPFMIHPVWIGYIFISTFFALLALPGVLMIFKRRAAIHAFKEMNPPTVSLCIGENGISANSTDSGVPWNKFEKLWEFPEALVLIQTDKQYRTIPKDCLTVEITEFIRGKINQQ